MRVHPRAAAALHGPNRAECCTIQAGVAGARRAAQRRAERAVGRFAGIVLVSLALACWPGREKVVGSGPDPLQPAQRDLARSSRGWQWTGGGLTMAAAAVRAALTILLAWTWLTVRQ